MLPNHSKSDLKIERYKSTIIPNKHFKSSNLDILHSGGLTKVIQGSDTFLHTEKPKNDDILGAGKFYSSHMIRVMWTKEEGWGNPKICPLQDLLVHPAAKALHYGEEVFDGLKAYRGIDNKIRLFRPMLNMIRLNSSAKRACLPTFDGKELLECIRRLVEIDQDWVPPYGSGQSFYIRPVIIATEAKLGMTPSDSCELYVIASPVDDNLNLESKSLRVYADNKLIRSWKGGIGHVMMAANYSSTFYHQKIATQNGCNENLWLSGDDSEIIECGNSNIFFLLKTDHSSEKPRLELATPHLESGLVLAGTTRQTVLDIAREWKEFDVNERKITMKELIEAQKSGRLLEAFTCGTMINNTLIKEIVFNDETIILDTKTKNSVSKNINEALNDIRYGIKKHEWGNDIENWTNATEIEVERYKEYKMSIDQFHEFLEPITQNPSLT